MSSGHYWELAHATRLERYNRTHNLLGDRSVPLAVGCYLTASVCTLSPSQVMDCSPLRGVIDSVLASQ